MGGVNKMQAAVLDSLAPHRARMKFTLEVSAELNITAHVARQRANHFLMMQVGNLLYAGEPELVVGQKVHWRAPVLYSLPGVGLLGKVGEVLVDADTGDVAFGELTGVESIERNVEALYRSTALPAGTEL